MKILLDTHIMLWWFANDAALSEKTRKIIANTDNVIFVSVASAWEITIKKALGKLQAPDDLESAISANNFEILPINIKHAIGISHLEPYHADPFDRILIAQAKIENLTLITHDKQILAYSISSIET